MLDLKALIAKKKNEGSVESSMLESLVIVAMLRNIKRGDFKIIAEWLGCYKYILPLERRILPSLKRYIAYKYGARESPTSLIEAQMLCDLVKTVLSQKQQEKILTFLIAYEETEDDLASTEYRDVIENNIIDRSPQKELTVKTAQHLHFMVSNGASADGVEEQLRKYAIEVIQKRFKVEDFL